MDRSHIEHSIMEVSKYYDTSTKSYRDFYGDTLQAGLISSAKTDRESNQYFIDRLSLVENDVIVDMGCGIGAMLIAISAKLKSFTYYGINISKYQSDICSHEIVPLLSECNPITILNADYHKSLITPNHANKVCFFESIGYSYNMPKLISEVKSVLKKSGVLYIKDCFYDSKYLDENDYKTLDIFNKTYRQKTPEINEFRVILNEAGFKKIEITDIDNIVDTKRFRSAFFDKDNNLTKFGKLHKTQPAEKCPVKFYEIIAQLN